MEVVGSPFVWFSTVCVLVTFIVPFVPAFFFILESADSSDTYECGMDPLTSSQAPIHIHFFLVGVLFLVFDVEIIVSIPLVFNSSEPGSWSVTWFLFSVILFSGLLLEITLGTLDWNE